ncbi:MULTISPECIES: hypothetical protein [unclassified Myroides]|uniref:hypothetical protein n=1 Tax=unclassified Myroides TaxID=2642485 RepID=UPI0015FD5700|nr:MULTISPECIES: hypothetical protein [unclassified Myroides]MBB1149806.1 hypothetical protein [Myroides sp. NP-2]MDM1408989.1 hypothetical protein [Myroides sp. DF42-4-2]
MTQEEQVRASQIKRRQLITGLFLDLLGMASYLLPGIGEFTDLIWAPISAFILAKMYPGKIGKVGAIVNFIEELAPGIDIIPTFTLTWVYTYYFQKKSF